jgi:hypothetical protein
MRLARKATRRGVGQTEEQPNEHALFNCLPSSIGIVMTEENPRCCYWIQGGRAFKVCR